MAGTLASPLAKLEWAERHYVTLKEEMGWAGELYERPLRVEADPNGLDYRFFIGEIQQPDPAWALRAGDVLFNLRASLDYLVYQLHVRRYKGRIPKDAAKESQFPILKDPRRKNGRRVPTSKWKEICRLPVRDQAAIQRLQPYVRRDQNLRSIRQSLLDINVLNNIDKHRELHVVSNTGLAVGRSVINVSTNPYWGPLVSHAQIDHWTFQKPPSDVKMNATVMLQVAIEQGGQYTGLLPLLRLLIGDTRKVIESFAKRFPPLS